MVVIFVKSLYPKADDRISLIESLFLLGSLVAYTVFLIVQSRKEIKEIQDEYAVENDKKSTWDASVYVQLILIDDCGGRNVHARSRHYGHDEFCHSTHGHYLSCRHYPKTQGP